MAQWNCFASNKILLIRKIQVLDSGFGVNTTVPFERLRQPNT
jgi:hypothetical protein